MKSPNIDYLPAIDHLRGLAALLIVFYHGLHVISYRLRFGAAFGFDGWLLKDQLQLYRRLTDMRVVVVPEQERPG